MLKEKGLELRSALQLRGKAEAKELPFVSTFLFFLGGGRGFYLRSACSCYRSDAETPTYPTAREMLLHCVQVYLALPRLTFFNLHFQATGLGVPHLKIKLHISANTIRHRFFSLHYAGTKEAWDRTSSPCQKPHWFPTDNKEKRSTAHV